MLLLSTFFLCQVGREQSRVSPPAELCSHCIREVYFKSYRLQLSVKLEQPSNLNPAPIQMSVL